MKKIAVLFLAASSAMISISAFADEVGNNGQMGGRLSCPLKLEYRGDSNSREVLNKFGVRVNIIYDIDETLDNLGYARASSHDTEYVLEAYSNFNDDKWITTRTGYAVIKRKSDGKEYAVAKNEDHKPGWFFKEQTYLDRDKDLKTTMRAIKSLPKCEDLIGELNKGRPEAVSSAIEKPQLPEGAPQSEVAQSSESAAGMAK